MNFSFYIARRYLFAKKKRNAINIISLISILGVAVGVSALVVVLSVFNGFDQVIQSLVNSFDPDLKISIIEGKTFLPEEANKSKIFEIDGVETVSEIFEETALIRYDEHQFIAILKGVDENYASITGVDTMMREGIFMLEKNNKPLAVVGQGVAYSLRIGLNFIQPLIFYVPKRTGEISMTNPTNSFNRAVVFPSGIFSIEQEYDSKYVLLPIITVRNLLEYSEEVTSLEIKIKDQFDKSLIQEQIKLIVGDGFDVLNRYEQNEVLYRIMKSEKWATFLILTLILIIASFNIVGSLTMLIIDKKEDILTLRNLGANESQLKNIFLTEGWLISIIGSGVGIILGTFVSLAQEHFGIIKIGGSGTFVI
ncbi:MAG: ABC transporter permease, partial [Bacteroidales bacterium]|nr:ABC transporter permease [Bacteroidales bacterium]